MKVDIAGVEFSNPVIVSSGTFGYGVEMEEYVDLNQIGGICLKTLFVEPRLGNKPPRVAETPSGMLNSVGLQGGGIDAFLKDVLPRLRNYAETRIIASIGGNTVEEYIAAAEAFGDSVDMLEMNISCPNVKCGGFAFGTDPHVVRDFVDRVKAVSKVPLIAKLSPNVTDIAEIARAAEAGGVDVISLINTVLAMKIDVNTRRPILANNFGGLSGPAVMPIAVRMVYQVAQAVSVPIIGMGGIRTYEDALEFMLAGASAVSVGSANFVYPDAAVRVKDGILEYMKKNNIDDFRKIIGKVEMH